MSIAIEETKVITVKDKNGTILCKGDPVLLRIRNQDIVCRYMGIENGYFSTETLEGDHKNQYRQGSIEDCVRISGIREYPEEDLKAASESGGQFADQPTLKPGA
jgi:hypothetical protein